VKVRRSQVRGHEAAERLDSQAQPLHVADAAFGERQLSLGPGIVTGCLTKKIRNSASPISTMLGGVPWVASALRSSRSTMTMRVKAVTITSRLGASDRMWLG